MLFPTISVRDIQRKYKEVLEKANKQKKPIVLVADDKPLGAVIGLDLLEKLQVDLIVKQALQESEDKKTVVIDTREKLEASFEEMRKEALIT